MESFVVWDPLNEKEALGLEIKASSAEDAAEAYAELDVDGLREGFYARGPLLHVKDEAGTIFKIRVTVDYEPTFYSEKSV